MRDKNLAAARVRMTFACIVLSLAACGREAATETGTLAPQPVAAIVQATATPEPGIVAATEVVASVPHCVIGTWQSGAEAMAEQNQAIQRNLPPAARAAMQRQMQVDSQQAWIEFRSDGTWASGSSSRAGGTGKNGLRIEADANVQASGTWREADGKLITMPQQSQTDGRIAATAPDGRRASAALKDSAHEMRADYSCNASTLQTTTNIPGLGPMVQTWQRVQ